MKINADFSLRASAHGAAMDWVPSPMPGVERRMFDRIGAEVARATSLVRYAPGSAFSAHTHDGGEEFLVLEGVFTDEHGDYPAGSYVRNPPTSRHTPSSGPGCTILVKLHQFEPSDRTAVRIAADRLAPAPAADRPGVAITPLYRYGREDVRIETWAAGAEIALAPESGIGGGIEGGLEAFVLAGGFSEGGEQFETHSWLRLPTGAPLRATAGPEGARVWVKTGHLAHLAV